ncbi:MAG: RluA family pseudouridine synthase [Opitutales bacterium]
MAPPVLHFSVYPEFGPHAQIVDLADLPEWVLLDSEDLLALNKPGWLVCHPSKNGPLSSLVGAVREWTGLETLHLIARLDRETSGIVLLAKHKAASRRLQMALQERRVTKHYLAILHGEMPAPIDVDQPIARHGDDPVAARMVVRASRTAQNAQTRFTPLHTGSGYTLAQVELFTGRKHQIRVHAEWLGHGVVGDKIYGPDSTLFLEFAEQGWTERLAATLPLRRQALHAAELAFDNGPKIRAPLAPELASFCREVVGVPETLLAEWC